VIVGGILTPLEDLFTWALVNLHDVTGSWSWSIVALTIIVRMLLVPLTVRQIHSMQNLQIHAPEMKAIQQKYKSDRKRQNEELMKFYRDNNINPAASCLPLVAQIPVFIGLFFVLRDFEDEVLSQPEHQDKGGLEWLGLVDITEDTLVGWGPVLLVVYVISQLTSTYLMSQQMQKAQRILMLVLPIVFIPFILSFPSGLMVYWLTTNLWTTGQGLVTRRFIPKPAPPEKRSSRTAPKTAPEAAPAEDGDAQPAAKTRSAGSGQTRRVRRKKKGGARR
jgi:YidC/Oxa1 family membrane protein insertase